MHRPHTPRFSLFTFPFSLRRLAAAAYVMVLAAMAVATVVEKSAGSAVVHEYIYGSWWFAALWAVVAAAGILVFVRSRVRRASVVCLHAALVLILIGALLTRLTARQGQLHLRIGEPQVAYGVTLSLTDFRISYYAGTDTPSDYQSTFTLADAHGSHVGTVAMNRIYTHGSLRLYQTSYDDDRRGSTLTVAVDPWGIPVTYTGYALFFLSLAWMLIDPRGRFRRLLRGLSAPAAAALLLAFMPAPALAAHEPDADLAHQLGRLAVLHNGRISQLQTLAADYVKKVYGHRTFDGLTPEQVLLGWITEADVWADRPMVRIKGKDLRQHLGLRGRYASLNDFFDPVSRAYRLGPLVRDYYGGQRDALHRQAADVDGRLQLLIGLRGGSALRLFPHTFDADYSRTHTESAVRRGDVVWYAPRDAAHSSVPRDEALFIRHVLGLIAEQVAEGHTDAAAEVIDKIATYQQSHVSLPPAWRVWAERRLNAVPLSTVLFMVNLTLGIAAFVIGIRRRPNADSRLYRYTWQALRLCALLSFVALTLLLVLRTMVGGRLPMANGYETMLVVAWTVQVVTLLMHRRVPIMLMFGLLLSGFILLVSHIGQMDPAIGPLMPVLGSPLLSVHVSFMMMSYALLSLTFVCGLAGLLRPRRAASMQTLSEVLLYPALAAMGVGIFVGAIWANVSWGRYWSWDPKETWALITLLIYALPAHPTLIHAMRRPRTYHVYMTVAFVAVLMTYFGVNYVLGGMHSYA